MRHALAIPGLVLMLIAAWMLYAGITLDTTIGASAGSQGIANLQLMHVQQLDVLLGAAAGIASAVLFAGAAIVVVLQENRAAAD